MPIWYFFWFFSVCYLLFFFGEFDQVKSMHIYIKEYNKHCGYKIFIIFLLKSTKKNKTIHPNGSLINRPACKKFKRVTKRQTGHRKSRTKCQQLTSRTTPPYGCPTFDLVFHFLGHWLPPEITQWRPRTSPCCSWFGGVWLYSTCTEGAILLEESSSQWLQLGCLGCFHWV